MVQQLPWLARSVARAQAEHRHFYCRYPGAALPRLPGLRAVAERGEATRRTGTGLQTSESPTVWKERRNPPSGTPGRRCRWRETCQLIRTPGPGRGCLPATWWPTSAGEASRRGRGYAPNRSTNVLKSTRAWGYGRIAGLQPVWPTDEVGVPLARVGSHAAPVPPLLGSRRFSAAARADAARGQSPGASRHRPGARYSARLQQL